MTMKRKLLYATGALILLLIHIIIAFALGVYVGRYGMTGEGLTLQGPRNPVQPAGQPGPPGPPDGQPAEPDQPIRPALLGEPAVIGRVRHIAPRMLDLASREGPRQVSLDADTRCQDPEGRLIGLTDLAEGQIVAVWGIFDDGGQQLKADLIVILPEQQPGPAEADPAKPPTNP